MNRSTRLLLPLLLTPVLLLAGRTGDLRDHSRDATQIVVGEIASTRSYFGDDGEIYTAVTLNARAALKGSKRALPTEFIVPGGVVGDTAVVFSDTPEFTGPESVIVFLKDGAPIEKYSLAGNWVPEMNESAGAVIDRIAESLSDLNEPVPASDRARVRDWVNELGEPVLKVTATSPTASCYALWVGKWGTGSATYSFDSTVPEGWRTALNSAAAAWTQGGSKFRFAVDPASANQIRLGGLAGSALASTRISYSPSTGRLNSFTITFNNAVAWSTAGEGGRFDVQNVAAHELGHALGLAHPSPQVCVDQTMWFSASSGETKKRSLEDGDKAGLVQLYEAGSNTAPPPPPPPAPTVSGLSTWASPARANVPFYFWLTGSGFSASSARVVITGGSCPSTGCAVQLIFRDSTVLFGQTVLPAGAYSIAASNGSTGTLSTPRSFSVNP